MWTGASPQGLGPEMLQAQLQNPQNPHYFAQAQAQAQAQISPSNQLISPNAASFTQMENFPMTIGGVEYPPQADPHAPGNFMYSPMAAGAPPVPQQPLANVYPQTKKRKADGKPTAIEVQSTSHFQTFSPPQEDEFGEFPTGDTLADNALDGDLSGAKRGMMKIPDAIDTIAKEGKSLRYNPKDQTYFVVNGTKFEEDFNSLRATRNKKSDSAKDRPFSRMHKFFTLIQGEKWACTGSIFVPKSARTGSSDGTPSVPEISAVAMPSVGSPSEDSMQCGATPPPAVSRSSSMGPALHAENVTIDLKDSNGESTAISLQQFLNATGAGELYKKAMASNGGGSNDFHFFDINQDGPLQKDDVYQIVGGMWTADSRGDQAYFFQRESGVLPMRNGAIVSLVNGKIVADQPATESGLYMVVSDNNAKWKGEPIPTAEEELEGHWCAFLGQVPVVVEGVVRTGDHIGPKCDGSGIGKVTEYGKGPVIGIAVQDKQSEAAGVLKTLVFAGLNAFKGGQGSSISDSQYNLLLQQNLATEEKLEVIKDNVVAIESNVAAIHDHVEGTKGDVATMETRLSLLERAQFWKARAKEQELEERSPSIRTAQVENVPSVPMGIPLNGQQQQPPPEDNSLAGFIRKHPLTFGAGIGFCITIFIGVILIAVLVPTLAANDKSGPPPHPPRPPKNSTGNQSSTGKGADSDTGGGGNGDNGEGGNGGKGGGGNGDKGGGGNGNKGGDAGQDSKPPKQGDRPPPPPKGGGNRRSLSRNFRPEGLPQDPRLFTLTRH